MASPSTAQANREAAKHMVHVWCWVVFHVQRDEAPWRGWGYPSNRAVGLAVGVALAAISRGCGIGLGTALLCRVFIGEIAFTVIWLIARASAQKGATWDGRRLYIGTAW